MLPPSGRVHFLGKIEKNETFMSLMSVRQRELLADYSEHLRQLRVCVEHNHEIIKLILQDVGVMFENSRHDEQVRPPASLDSAKRPLCLFAGQRLP